MKLMTKEIEARLPKLQSTEETPLSQRNVAVKYFTPDANWTWYALEGERTPEGDVLFFGLVLGTVNELGYFTLSELESAKGPLGLTIERDLHFEGTIPKQHLPSWAT